MTVKISPSWASIGLRPVYSTEWKIDSIIFIYWWWGRWWAGWLCQIVLWMHPGIAFSVKKAKLWLLRVIYPVCTFSLRKWQVYIAVWNNTSVKLEKYDNTTHLTVTTSKSSAIRTRSAAAIVCIVKGNSTKIMIRLLDGWWVSKNTNSCMSRITVGPTYFQRRPRKPQRKCNLFICHSCSGTFPSQETAFCIVNEITDITLHHVAPAKCTNFAVRWTIWTMCFKRAFQTKKSVINRL